MANGDEDRDPSWSSWFAPGDTRHVPKQDIDVKRPAPAVAPTQARDAPKPESNPLITFKHFVDDAFSAVANFSKNLKDMREAALDEHDEAYKRWTGAENTAHLMESQSGWVIPRDQYTDIAEPSDQVKATVKLLLLESARRNTHVSPSKLTALFEDPASETDHGEYHPRWLSIDWFKNSWYSPVNLEADPVLAKYDTKWRHAFEDLLEAALDKPMTSREKFGYRDAYGPISTWRGPGLDWMLSLQCRGILPPQLPTMYFNGRIASEFLREKGLTHTILESICSNTCHQPRNDLLDSFRMEMDYYNLSREIGTPTPDDTAKSHLKLEAPRVAYQQSTRVDDVGEDDYEDENCSSTQTLRQPTPERASMQEPATTGGCPDELDRAVSEAIRSLDEFDTELDIYEQMYQDWLQDSAHQTSENNHHEQAAHELAQLGDQLKSQNQRDRLLLLAAQQQQRQGLERQQGLSSDSQCPDELGRDVGDFARQETARAFADEENGLIVGDGRLGTRVVQCREEWLDHERRLREGQSSSHVTRCPDELGRAVSDAARQDAAHEYEILLRLLEQQRRQQRLDIERQFREELPSSLSARCPDDLGRAVGDVARQYAARAFADEEEGPTDREVLAWIEQQRRLDNETRDTDMIELYEEIAALRNSHDDMVEELWKTRAQFEQQQKSHKLEQAKLSPALSQASNQAGSDRPQILSTLTTTETMRLPDGSVKTTVVLKRRFANGLEETQESTQTSFEESTASNSGGRELSKKGWFWS